MPDFELTKWYADCVSERGDACILYSAELAFPPIRYTSLLRLQDGRPAQNRFSLRKQASPEMRDGCIEWNSRRWKAEGQWSCSDSSIRETLFDSPDGSLEWECLAPRAGAYLRTGDEPEIRGWGYVERLRLSVAPWRLPIRELRWGRFINGFDALVWIDWRGPYNRQVVYHNGAAVPARSIGDTGIELSDGAVLRFEASTPLREGRLGATALAVIPHVDRLFPASILNVRERKWLSRAVLRRAGCADSTGMAIHEVVEWP
ncbi:MAG TPA: hypothetical protein VML19_26900 [Verrucomicrobiae bacterium]|nr:hypothetical protein [Verrucomicrobiae bacterium]